MSARGSSFPPPGAAGGGAATPDGDAPRVAREPSPGSRGPVEVAAAGAPSIPPAGAPPGGPGARFHRPELDGLRFAAALAVLASHAWPREAARWDWLGPWRDAGPTLSRAGSAGVDLFFVLSAYLITELLRRELAAAGRIDLAGFWIRRSLRIWPLYFAYLGGCGLAAVATGRPEMPAGGWMAFAAFLGNWWNALSGPAPASVVHLWTVGVEEQFYVAWPLLVVLLPRRLWVAACLAMILGAHGTRMALLDGPNVVLALNNNTAARMDCFAAGAGLALLLGGRMPALRGGLRWAGVLAGCGLVFGVVHLSRAESANPWPGAPWVFAARTAGATLILVSVLGSDAGSPTPGGLLSRGLLVELGKRSYGFYVFHVVVLHAAEAAIRPEGATGRFLVLPVVAAVATAAVSWVSYRILERPFLARKARWTVVPSRPI